MCFRMIHVNYGFVGCLLLGGFIVWCCFLGAGWFDCCLFSLVLLDSYVWAISVRIASSFGLLRWFVVVVGCDLFGCWLSLGLQLLVAVFVLFRLGCCLIVTLVVVV